MAIIVSSKIDAAGSVTPTALSTDTVVYQPAVQSNDALIEGEVSLVNMASGDTVVLSEWMALDGTTFELINQQSYSGVQADPVIRYVGKMIGPSVNGTGGGVAWKASVNQTAGTLRAFPYSFVLEVLGST